MADIELVIKIPDHLYKVLKDFKDFPSDSNETTIENVLIKAVENGTPIPDNDCNNCEKAWTDKCERAECYENNYKHWTPYQKGNKE